MGTTVCLCVAVDGWENNNTGVAATVLRQLSRAGHCAGSIKASSQQVWECYCVIIAVLQLGLLSPASGLSGVIFCMQHHHMFATALTAMVWAWLWYNRLCVACIAIADD
eukprot:GHRR01020385.1.p3 GENE.GHRR01020385.1~~GHRR01020385.1.p3  ORF type:complete len:109 (-),score=35.86 GHRR01020385.1:372-698(-)